MPILDVNKYIDTNKRPKKGLEREELLFHDGDVEAMAWEDYVKALEEENALIEAFDALSEQEKAKEKAEKILRDSIATEHWWDGIKNFFHGIDDRMELDDYELDKTTGQWTKDGKEVPFEELEEKMENDASKIATSGAYTAGKAVYDFVDGALSDNFAPFVTSLLDLGVRGITGITDAAGITHENSWGDTEKAQFYNAVNYIKDAYSGISHGVVDLYNDAQNFLGIDSDEETKKDKFDNNLWYSYRKRELEKEREEIKELGEKGLKERAEIKKSNKQSATQKLFDNIYDASGIEGWRYNRDNFNNLKSLIQQRALDIEGVQKETFSSNEGEISDEKYKYQDPNTGEIIEIPKEKGGGDDGQSKSVYDIKKLIIDPTTGKPERNIYGDFMYEDKYSLAEKIANSNFGALTDKYYLSEEITQGASSMVGFMGTGMLINSGISKLGKLASKAGKAINSATKLDRKLLNYTNKMMTNVFKKPMTEAKLATKVNKINNKLNLAVRQTAQSYLMTNTESYQIGVQVQREIINKSIDDANEYTTEDAIKELIESGQKFISYQAMILKADSMVEKKRNEWKDEHKEEFNDIVNRSIIGRDAAISANNINFINNLTSAGLFVRGKSIARKILKNPFSRKALRLGAWTLAREGFQEGFIEEGVINSYAEKLGKAAGNLKFYTLKDFAKNDVGTSEFAENVFIGGLMGIGQTGLMKGANLRGDYKRYNKQKKQIQELEKIGVIKDKDTLLKILNYSLDKDANEAVKMRIDALESEGKKEEAGQLVDALLLNKAVNAAETGTTSVLTEQMNKLLESDFLDEQDKADLKKATRFNEMVGDVFDKYHSYHNQSGITNNRANKFLLEEDYKALTEDFKKTEDAYNETIDRLVKKRLKDKGILENDLNYITEYDKVKKDVEQSTKAEESNSTIREYRDAKKTIDTYKKTIEDLDEQYEYMTSTKGQKEIVEKRNKILIQRALLTVTQDNIKEVKKTLKKNNLLTKDITKKLEDTAKKRKLAEDMPVNETKKPPVTDPETSTTPTESTVEKTPEENFIEKTEEGKRDLPDDPIIEELKKEFREQQHDPTDPMNNEEERYDGDDVQEKANLNDLLSLSPQEIDSTDNQQKKIIDKYEDILRRGNKNLQDKGLSGLDENSAFAIFAEAAGINIAERNFNLFKNAFKKSGIKQTENFDWDAMYDSYFGIFKEFSKDTSIPKPKAPTSNEVIDSNDEKEAKIIANTNPVIAETPDKIGIRYSGQKISEPTPKISFLGVEYTEEVTEDGVVKKDKKATLNTNSSSDLNILLDPDNMLPGTEFEAIIPKDADARLVTVYYKNKQGLMIRQVMTFGEYVKLNNIKEGSNEWIAKVPIDFILPDGSVIKNGMHDASTNGWWRRENVADFLDREEITPHEAAELQAQLVKDGREKSFDIRKKIYNNIALYNRETKMVIVKRRSGVTTKIDKKGTLQSIKSADPNAEIVIVTDIGFTTEKRGKVKIPFPGLIEQTLNLDYTDYAGYVFIAVRSSTATDEAGDNKPVYRVIQVHTDHDQSALKELRKSLKLLYDAYDIIHGKVKNPTEAQKQFAERVRQGVKDISGGYDIKLGIGENHYNLKDLYPVEAVDENGKKTGRLYVPVQITNISTMPLPIISSDGTVVNYEGGYKGMLMDHLATEKQFFTITDKNGKERRTPYAQPIITFDTVSEESKPNKVDIKPKNLETALEEENKKHQADLAKIDEKPITQEDKEKEKKPIEVAHKVNIEEIKKNNKAIVTKEEESTLTFTQRKVIVEYLFHKILGSFSGSYDEVRISHILKKIESSFEKYLLKDLDPESSEYKLLIKYKDELLGLGEHKDDINTVKQMLSSFLNESIEESANSDENVDEDGIIASQYNKNSFEIDVRVSLSTRLKMFFAGIERKNAVPIFGNIPTYYSLDEVFYGLQDMLSDVSNTESAFKNKIKLQIEKNKEEFGYLQDVADRFDKTTLKVKKEILYRLNQTKVDMYFILYSRDADGNYVLQTYDANSANPNIKLLQHFQQTFKQSDLIDANGEEYTVNVALGEKLLKQYLSWEDNIDNVSNEELLDWLAHFGIIVSPKTMQDYREGTVSDSLFATAFSKNITPKYYSGSSLFNQLATNLNKFLAVQEMYPDTKFNIEEKLENMLLYNNNNYLKNLIKVEVNNTSQVAGSIYMGGKIVNSFAKPNFTTEQIRKLKDPNNRLANDLHGSAFSKDSYLLNLILYNNEVRDILGVGYVGLDAIKRKGGRNRSDNSIKDLSVQDYKVLLLGFLQNEGKRFYDEELLKKYGIKSLREMKMTFPTLSDSSQMLLLNTVGISLHEDNFEFDEKNIPKLDDSIIEFLYTQLVLPDLNRIEMYLRANKDTPLSDLSVGSQLFTMIPALNSLEVDFKGTNQKLLSIVHEAVRKGHDVTDIIEDYKDDIYNKIRDVVKNSVDNKLKYDGKKLTGSWVKNGVTSKKGVIMDKKYLDSLGKKKLGIKMLIASYDFTINYMLNQAQIQMLFAGDIDNYIGNGARKNFNDGDVTSPKLSDNQKESDVYAKIIKDASINLSKRLKQLISPGNRIAESYNEEYVQIMVNDVISVSKTIEYYAKQFYPEKYEKNKDNLEKIKELEAEIDGKLKDGKSVESTKKEYDSLKAKLQKEFPAIKDYFDITATDAQEYTTWKEHLHILLNQGRISKKEYRRLYSKLQKHSDQSRKGLPIENKDKLSETELKLVFQPLKPLHAGLYFEHMFDGNEYIGKKQRFVYIKTSSFPLLPGMTHNTQLDKLRDNMERFESVDPEDSSKGVRRRVRLSYQSGNKVGAVKNAMNIQELYSDWSEDLHEKIGKSSLILKRENFSIQQDKPFKANKNLDKGHRDETNVSSQFEKIILGNGINKISKKIFPSIFDEEVISKLNIEVVDGNISGVDLYKIYNHLAEEEQKYKRDYLHDLFGLNKDGDYHNDVATMEKIQSLLKKRLTNQQDKDLLELRYKVIEFKDNKHVNSYFSKKELIAAGYTLADVESAEFTLPLWVTPNSQKFESVLNSVIDKALIHIKHRGYASPVGTEQGLKVVEEDKIDTDGIIYTDNYDPKKGLTATYVKDKDGKTVVQYAQVFVSNKLRTERYVDGKKEYINVDLTKYTKKVGNRTIIDTEKIDPEVLKLFSYRIPVSSHVSGSIIEIVGFLPDNNADLMIVPKDHSKQIGEDYDIDIRYSYHENYYIEHGTGKIKRVDSKYIKDEIEYLENKNDEKYLIDFLEKFKVFINNEELNELINEETPLERKKNLYISKLKYEVLENQLLAMYKSVYTSTNPEVQKMINSPLNTDLANATANIIDEATQNENNSETFTIFDDEYQENILKSGASGQFGVGVHSNWVVFNSLVQQVEDDEGVSLKGAKITIGSFTSDGKLGLIKSLVPTDKRKKFRQRYLSDINMENQNAAVDNQKLLIMGKRNENKHTINAFSLMCNLGFDIDYVNNKEVHLPSLFLAQPILKRYVELKENAKSSFSQKRVEEEDIINELIKEFDPSGKTKKESLVYGSRNLTAKNLYDNLTKHDTLTQITVLMTFNTLNKYGSSIIKLQQMTSVNKGLGKSFFDLLNKKEDITYGRAPLHKVIDGVDKLFGDYKFLSESTQEERDKLIADGYIPVEDESTESMYFIKPNSPNSRKIINSISTGYNLLRNVFPYQSLHIGDQIDEILIAAYLFDVNTKYSTEVKYKIIAAMKDYLYSYSHIDIYDKDIETERNSLFFDGDTTKSLASFLNKLKKEKHPLFNNVFFKDLQFTLGGKSEPNLIKYTTNNKNIFNKNSTYILLKSLHEEDTHIGEYNGDKNYTTKKLVKDLIKYSLLSNQENGAIGFLQHIPVSILEEYGVIKALERYTNVTNIGSHNIMFNGNFKGLKNLMGDISSEKGILRNYKKVPLNIIEHFVDRINNDFGEEVAIIDSNTGDVKYSAFMDEELQSVFVKQFFQHNPEISVQIKEEDIIDTDTGNFEGFSSFYITDKKFDKYLPKFVHTKSKDGSIFLFENVKDNLYVEVNKLGSHGMNEYVPLKHMNKSLVESNNVENVRHNKSNVIPINFSADNTTTDEVIQKLSLNHGVEVVLDNIERSKNEYSDIAALLKMFTKSHTKVEIIDGNIGNGVYIPNSMGEYGQSFKHKGQTYTVGNIYLSKELINTKDIKLIQKVILEELLHSVTVDEINKYVDTNSSTFDKNGEITIKYLVDNPPAHIIKLVSLFKVGAKHILNKYKEGDNIDKAIKRYNENKQYWIDRSKGKDVEGIDLTPEEATDTYRTLNLGEFIAGIFFSKDFRDEMSRIPYKSSNKTLFEHIRHFIAELLRSIVPEIPTQSLSARVIEETFNVLEKETGYNKKYGGDSTSTTKTKTDHAGEKLLGEKLPEVTNNISTETDESADLSNSAIRPFIIEANTGNGIVEYTFQTVEQGLSFHKATIAGDKELANKILEETDTNKLRSLIDSKNLKMSKERLELWNNVNEDLMEELMYQSFRQNMDEANKLLATGNTKFTHQKNGIEQDNGEFSKALTIVRDRLKDKLKKKNIKANVKKATKETNTKKVNKEANKTNNNSKRANINDIFDPLKGCNN